MKKSKRILLFVCATLLCLALFAACNKKEEEPPIDDEPENPDWTMVLSDDGQSYEARVYSGNDAHIIIPASHMGLPVIPARALFDGPNSKYDFIESITFPEHLKELSIDLGGLKNLKSVTIPEGVTTIDAVFGESLTTFNIPENVTTIKYLNFKGTELVIPKSVTTIEGLSFKGTSLVIPENVTTLGRRVGGPFLEKLEIRCKITAIDDNFMKENKVLKELVISGNVTKIGEHAFSDCTSLERVTIENGVKSIGVCAFQNCTSLTSITIPDSVETIDRVAFQYCYNLKEVTLGTGVKSIGNWCFWDCLSLSKLTLNEGLETIGESAFRNCTSLTELVIPDSVVTVGERAFENCENLLKVTIGTNVTDLGFFHSCPKIVEIYNRSKSIDLSNDWSQHFPSTYDPSLGFSVPDILRYFYTPEKGGPLLSVDEEGFIFTELKNRLYLVGYCGDEKMITLPDYAIIYQYDEDGNYVYDEEGNRKLVKKDNDYYLHPFAFYNRSDLVSISMPDSKSSGPVTLNTGSGSLDGAFYGCHKLVLVNGVDPENLGSEKNGHIGYYALTIYKGDESSTGVTVTVTDDGFIFYNDSTSTVCYLMGYVGEKTSVTLPEYFTGDGGNKGYAVYKYAFADRRDVTEVVIPETVTEIGENAFLETTTVVKKGN